MKPLVQHQYAHSWIKMNAARDAEFDTARNYIAPRGTVATRGHFKGAQLSRERAESACLFLQLTMLPSARAAVLCQYLISHLYQSICLLRFCGA